MIHSSNLIRASLVLLLTLPVFAMQAPPTAPLPPEGPAKIEHPPELTPAVKKALEKHCAKQHDACEPPMKETPAAAAPVGKPVTQPPQKDQPKPGD